MLSVLDLGLSKGVNYPVRRPHKEVLQGDYGASTCFLSTGLAKLRRRVGGGPGEPQNGVDAKLEQPAAVHFLPPPSFGDVNSSEVRSKSKLRSNEKSDLSALGRYVVYFQPKRNVVLPCGRFSLSTHDQTS